MHTPTPDPMEDEEEPDVKQPPVPPDEEPEVVPQRDPPDPDESRPLIVLRAKRVARRERASWELG